MSILDHIAEYKREEIAQKKAISGFTREMFLKADHAAPPRPFHLSLRQKDASGDYALIAEIKRASPSRGMIRDDFDPLLIAQSYAEGGATCLSILTDRPSFQGKEDDLISVRTQTSLPILRKDFMLDVWQVAESRAMGADCILIIMALVDDICAKELESAACDYGMDVLIEVHNEAELARALTTLHSPLLGINNRDLHRFETSLTTTETLIKNIPDTYFVVSESGIFTNRDLARLKVAGAGAFLVGESLMREKDIMAATKKLLGEE